MYKYIYFQLDSFAFDTCAKKNYTKNKLNIKIQLNFAKTNERLNEID